MVSTLNFLMSNGRPESCEVGQRVVDKGLIAENAAIIVTQRKKRVLMGIRRKRLVIILARTPILWGSLCQRSN
jgi:hypothetical protein